MWPLWKSLAAPQNVKCEGTTSPSNSAHTYIPQRNENICSPTNLYTNVCGSIIDNSQKVQPTEMPISWWTDKGNAVYPCDRILFDHKKKNGRHIFKWKHSTLFKAYWFNLLECVHILVEIKGRLYL